MLPFMYTDPSGEFPFSPIGSAGFTNFLNNTIGTLGPETFAGPGIIAKGFTDIIIDAGTELLEQGAVFAWSAGNAIASNSTADLLNFRLDPSHSNENFQLAVGLGQLAGDVISAVGGALRLHSGLEEQQLQWLGVVQLQA